MPRRRFVFESPSRFVPGTVGEPGNRAFYLQAKQGRAVLSVALEKVQVSLLADRLGVLLQEIARRGGASISTEPAAVERDTLPLDEPVVGIFRVGVMTLGWDATSGDVLIEARAETGDEPDADEPDAAEDFEPFTDEEGDEGPDILRVQISPAMALTFIERARRVVAAGRPPCPLCGLPLNPGGHICPRRNGTLLN